MPTQINLHQAEDIAPEAPPASVRVRRERTAPGRVPTVRVPAGWYPPVKAAAEFVLALMLTVVALPVMALCAVAVKLSSSGPAFYTQTRVGVGGRHLDVLRDRRGVARRDHVVVHGDPRRDPPADQDEGHDAHEDPGPDAAPLPPVAGRRRRSRRHCPR